MTRATNDDAGGYVAYTGSTGKGLANQGWKDSGDCIVNADGTLARPPIALVEVQGYAWLARRAIAELYERAGERARSDGLRRDAENLRARFNRDFWAEGLGTFALALQKGGERAEVVTSNAGQALWTGIAEPDKARRTADRLMADDMFSGWGIRTLSSRERRYNPIGYHVGTVWPHDNALIAAGFRRYGFDAEALRIFEGILAAAMDFEHDRLPEVFAGFTRREYEEPVRYPVACHPQAWAAGAVPYLLQACLGLVPDAFGHRLSVVRPVLPRLVRELHVRRLRVGDASTDLHVERGSDGAVSVTVLRVDGRLDVVVDAPR
jgi:glycogen debranching enzyme